MGAEMRSQEPKDLGSSTDFLDMLRAESTVFLGWRYFFEDKEKAAHPGASIMGKVLRARIQAHRSDFDRPYIPWTRIPPAPGR
jgi:hypothetical protein